MAWLRGPQRDHARVGATGKTRTACQTSRPFLDWLALPASRPRPSGPVRRARGLHNGRALVPKPGPTHFSSIISSKVPAISGEPRMSSTWRQPRRRERASQQSRALTGGPQCSRTLRGLHAFFPQYQRATCCTPATPASFAHLGAVLLVALLLRLKLFLVADELLLHEQVVLYALEL
jgi:hypothetical protein